MSPNATTGNTCRTSASSSAPCAASPCFHGFAGFSPFTRRSFLKTACMVTTALALDSLSPLCSPAFAKRQSYRGVTYLTPAYKALMYGISGFVSYLNRYAADVLKVDFFDSGALMKADDQLMGLKSGSVQFMFHTTSYLTAVLPILSIIGLPGVCEGLYRHGERIAMESPLWKLINDELAKSNLFMLSAGGGVFEPEYLWSSKQRIAGLADLEGKRCRVVSYEGTEIMKSFGAEGVRLLSSEISLALQRGTLDVIVANISTITGRSLYDQLKFCFQVPVTAYSIGIFILKDRWDKMEEREKSAFWQAAQWYDRNAVSMANTTIYPREEWPTVKSAGIEVAQPSDEDLKTFAQNAQPILAWWKDQVGEEIGARAIGLAMGKA